MYTILGIVQAVLIREVFVFQGVLISECSNFRGAFTSGVSLLQGCPYFMSVLI